MLFIIKEKVKLFKDEIYNYVWDEKQDESLKANKEVNNG